MEISPIHSIAATRFGLGAQRAEYADMGADPKAWLAAQTADDESSALPGTLPAPSDFFELVWGGQRVGTMAETGLEPAQTYEFDLKARCRFAASTQAPFRERMVHFWSNHFSISGRGSTGGIVGAFDRDVVRPRVMGRFEDLLLASSSHPLMIAYLENNMSIGPNSEHGRRHALGLNENLAREILELHTLGVDGGYTQTDIVELARAISGWTFNEENESGRPYFAFRFDARRHEPGERSVLGKTYAPGGFEQGKAILKDLAHHPSTAAHIAQKLARHFHSDDPPASLVARIKTVFLETRGDLGAVSRALVASPELWDPRQRKVKNTDDYWVSILRSVAPAYPEDWRINWAYVSMNQPIWGATSPAGWPDSEQAWASPGVLRQRMYATLSLVFDYVNTIDTDIETFGRKVLGPFLTEQTRAAMAGLSERNEQLVVLFMSPEFQRR